MSTDRGPTGLARVAEVAEHLGVSRAQIYVLMEKGELEWVKLPGAAECPRSRRVPWQSVHALVERCRVGRAAQSGA
jgi:excisionase family DNA binding protein